MGRDWSAPELRALKRMHWLQELVLANDDGITDAQLERFGKSPECIIPELVVALREIPMEFSQISDPMLSADGEFAFLAKRNNEQFAVVSDRETRIGLARESDLTIRELIEVVEREPLWVRTHAFMAEDYKDDDWDLQARWTLFLGTEQLFETRGVTGCLQLKDGSFIYCACNKTKNQYRIVKFRDGKNEIVAARFPYPVHRFVELVDGTIWVLWLEGKGTTPMCGFLTDKESAVCPTVESGDRNRMQGIVDVVTARFGTRFVRQLSCGRVELADIVGEHDHRLQARELGEVEYVGGYTGIEYVCEAYIGKARHGKQRWVVGKIPQPAMDWVSRLFNHPKFGWCYLALSGQYILTMRIPKP